MTGRRRTLLKDKTKTAPSLRAERQMSSKGKPPSQTEPRAAGIAYSDRPPPTERPSHRTCRHKAGAPSPASGKLTPLAPDKARSVERQGNGIFPTKELSERTTILPARSAGRPDRNRHGSHGATAHAGASGACPKRGHPPPRRTTPATEPSAAVRRNRPPGASRSTETRTDCARYRGRSASPAASSRRNERADN